MDFCLLFLCQIFNSMVTNTWVNASKTMSLLPRSAARYGSYSTPSGINAEARKSHNANGFKFCVLLAARHDESANHQNSADETVFLTRNAQR